MICVVVDDLARTTAQTLPLNHLGPDVDIPRVVDELHHGVVVLVILEDPGVDELPHGAVGELTEEVDCLGTPFRARFRSRVDRKNPY